MKKILLRSLSALICIAILFTAVACGSKKSSTPVDGRALLQVLLEKVTFETELKSAGEQASLYFTGLPAGAGVTLYSGSAYYADCVALITVYSEADRADAVQSLKTYMSQMSNHFMNYQPDQVSKFDNAVIWEDGIFALLCVTADYKTAKDIVNNAATHTANYTPTEGTQTAATTEATAQVTEAPTTETPTEEPTTEAPITEAPTTETPTEAPTTEAPTEEPTTEEPTTEEPTTEAPTVAPTEPYVPSVTTRPDGYPAITSTTGKFYNYGTGAYRVDDTAFENYFYDEAAANAYAAVVNSAYETLAGKVNVYDMVIPTAIGIVFPDDMVSVFKEYQPQDQRLNLIYSKINDGVIKVNAFDNLMRHRNEYLYFRTDFHWNGAAAYYAYEVFCQEKGVTPYTLDQRKHVTFDNFYGALYYNNCNKDSQLRGDVVHAYYPYSSNVSMVYTDRKGNQVKWNVISDVSAWADYSKYNTFAGGDNPITVYTNPDVTDGSVGIIVKESFGNALISYLVDHYSVLYEIDYRYWDGNIADFALEKGATDLLFANNIGMVRSSVLVGMLADNFT